MEVTKLSADTFWKGETEIKGTVEEKGKLYGVRILRKGSHVFDYSCSRVDANGKKLELCSMSCGSGKHESTMCTHARAVLMEHERKNSKLNMSPISTSQQVRSMIREYTKKQVNRAIESGEETRVRLVPDVIMSKDEIRVRFMLGRERMYLIKDLVAFAHAIEKGQMMEYGRTLSFYHCAEAFEESCRPLLYFIIGMIETYRTHFFQFRRAMVGNEPVLPELTLQRTERERFFALMEGNVLECEDVRKIRRNLLVTTANPKFCISLEKQGNDGVKLQIPHDIVAYHGEKHLFVADTRAVYRCDEEYTDALSELMDTMASGTDSDRQVIIHNRDMPMFYERVLKKLAELKLIRGWGVNLEQYKPEPLNVRFYFDSKGASNVTLRPELSYGTVTFHPLKEEEVSRDVCRDMPGEYAVSKLITRYFRFTEEETGDPVIHGDDEALYHLLMDGMEQFSRLGEVFLSESFKEIRLLPSVGISTHVRSSGQWLHLEVELDGVSEDELQEVLAAYKAKKKFFRMKNGDFLLLGDSGLITLSNVAEYLGVEKMLMSGKTIQIPSYHAAFLDYLMKEYTEIHFDYDSLFDALAKELSGTDDGKYELPESLQSVLRPYQKQGYQWMKTMDSYGFGGILADEMGLGKTLQVIALLLDQKQREDGVSLIVCPASLVYNWASELRTFAPEISVEVMAGSPEEREMVMNRLETEQFAGVQVMITSYDLLKRDMEWYLKQEFRYQIIDEAQYIKTASTQVAKAVKLIKAKTKFALTGTPVENHLSELWSIFDFLMPGLLFTYTKFRRLIEIPIVIEKDQAALTRLKKITGPFILRRLKKDVLTELPDKLEKILYSGMEGEQKQLYQAHAARLRDQLKNGSAEEYEADRMQILAELMKLRQICCQPSLCFSNYKGESAKLETCMSLLKNGAEGGHKILLFSQFTSMLDIIAKRLRRERISYYILTGATSKQERMRMVTSFAENNTKVFLISLKAGGTGLNLTAADVVIHYDPWWNVAAENQATDRAHRIGQENQVTVFKLITEHTIEENILKLQEMKKELADSVITEEAGGFSSLSREELLEMLDETQG